MDPSRGRGGVALKPRALGGLPFFSGALPLQTTCGDLPVRNSWDGVPSGLMTGPFPRNPL